MKDLKLALLASVLILAMMAFVTVYKDSQTSTGPHRGSHCASNLYLYTNYGTCLTWEPDQSGTDYGQADWTWTNGWSSTDKEYR